MWYMQKKEDPMKEEKEKKTGSDVRNEGIKVHEQELGQVAGGNLFGWDSLGWGNDNDVESGYVQGNPTSK